MIGWRPSRHRRLESAGVLGRVKAHASEGRGLDSPCALPLSRSCRCRDVVGRHLETGNVTTARQGKGQLWHRSTGPGPADAEPRPVEQAAPEEGALDRDATLLLVRRPMGGDR